MELRGRFLLDSPELFSVDAFNVLESVKYRQAGVRVPERKPVLLGGGR